MKKKVSEKDILIIIGKILKVNIKSKSQLTFKN